MTEGGKKFNFITYNDAPDFKNRKNQNAVRSHVTRLQHEKKGHRLYTYDHKSGSVNPRGRGIRAEPAGHTAENVIPSGSIRQNVGHQPVATASARSSAEDNTKQQDKAVVRRPRQHVANVMPAFSAVRIVSASKIAANVSRQTVLQDPGDRLASILARLNLDFPTVMEHYRWIVFTQSLDFESIFMPDLERGAGYETLVSRIARDPALTSSAALVATGHILAIRNTTVSRHIARCILELKAFVLNAVNEALRDPVRATSDPLICAILILASHEGLQGSHENFHIHMRGLLQMINLRGGLACLNETQKWLEAFVIWQDTNVSTIMRCEPYWKQAKNRTTELPIVKPNPMMWLLRDS